MHLDKYSTIARKNHLIYEFYSEGPKGRIKKAVRFSPQNRLGISFYNLGFGDWNEKKKRIDDLARTNNNDKQKILATIAAIVLEFTDHFPDALIYAKGSTAARTRLYQMGIAANWHQIKKILRVYGYTNEGWQEFHLNINYDAFLAMRK